MSSTSTVPIESATTRSGPRKATGWDGVKAHVPFALIVWLAHLVVTQLIAFISYRSGDMRSVRWVKSTNVFEPDVGHDSSAYGLVRPELEGWQHWIVEPFRNW
ncbi:MAG: hypothetical protein K5924_12675, partial [Chloroflexi bacterium]|nr:hypothetical protein [Chloroflexota bacterium]